MAADCGLTGLLHLDGLADTADGLLPASAAPGGFEVMGEPRVGAFGAVALVLVLSLRFAALATTVARAPGGGRAVVRLAHLDGRVVERVPYARAQRGPARPSRRGPPAASPSGSPRGMGAAALAALGAGDRGRWSWARRWWP